MDWRERLVTFIVGLSALIIMCGIIFWNLPAKADHHDTEMCQPIAVPFGLTSEQALEFLDDSVPTCSRGGEGQNVTFSVPALQPGQFVGVPIRISDSMNVEDWCEIGWRFNHDSSIGYAGFRVAAGAMDAETRAHIFDVIGGDFTSSSLPEPSVLFGNGMGGSVFVESAEAPDATATTHLRLWAYSGDVVPMYPVSSRTRIFGWVLFRVNMHPSFNPSGPHILAQSDGWIDAAIPGQSCGCPVGGLGRSCTGTYTLWQDAPNGVDTNQLQYNIGCWSADFDRDGAVGLSDFGIFRRGFGQTGYYAERRCDSDDDGDCDVVDLGAFKQRFSLSDPSCF